MFQINGYSSDFKSLYREYLGCSKRAKDRTHVGKRKHSVSRWTLSSGCRVVPVEGLILRGAWHLLLPLGAESLGQLAG